MAVYTKTQDYTAPEWWYERT